MLEILSPVTTAIGVTNVDFAVGTVVAVFCAVFAFLGAEKSYSAFYGTLVGIGIYVVLQTLLSPAYQTAATSALFGPGVSKFLVASSAYLVPILFFLSPINGKLHIEGASNRAVRILEAAVVAGVALLLVCAVVIGLSNRAYVFSADTAFTLLKKAAWFTALSAESDIFGFLSKHLQPIVLASVFFGIYKAFFGEIVSAAAWAAISAVLKKKSNGGSHEEASSSQDEHGHADHGHDEGDFDDGHDDHGRGGHGHH